MKSDNDTAWTGKNSGEKTSLTPSADLLSRILGTSASPRMLTPYETRLLQQSKKEMVQVISKLRATKKNSNE